MSKTTSKVDAQRAMREAKFAKTPKRLPPMQHPEGEPIVGAQIDGDPFPDHPAHDKPVIAETAAQVGSVAVTPGMLDGAVEVFSSMPPFEAAPDSKKLTIRMPTHLHRELKVMAAEWDSTIEALTVNAVETFMDARRGKVPLIVSLDDDLYARVSEDARSLGMTIEAWVEAAIRQELKARVS